MMASNDDPLATPLLVAIVSEDVSAIPSTTIPADETTMTSFHWPMDAASAVQIVVVDSPQSSSSSTMATLEYNATDRYVHLVATTTSTTNPPMDSSRTVLDTIDVDDMIGASIEISMMKKTGHHAGDHDDNHNGIRACSNSSLYQCNEPIFLDVVDTQACAVLHVYVYPRQAPKVTTTTTTRWWWWLWQQLACCSCLWFRRRRGPKITTAAATTTAIAATPNYQRPADPVAERYGPRRAQHRTWTLAPAEDLAAAQTIVQALRRLSRPSCVGTNHTHNNNNNNSSSINSNSSDDDGNSNNNKCLLLVNPRSGPHQNAAHLAERQVIPMLEQAGLEVTLCVTTHPRHATERCQEEDARDGTYAAIVTVGGDGILHEALNGLFKATTHNSDNYSEDNNNVCHPPTSASSPSVSSLPALGVIGCGTANGLATSLCWAAGETSSDILTHTFLIAKGQTVSADLSEYTITTPPPITTLATPTILSDDNAADSNNNNNGNGNMMIKNHYTSFLTFMYGLIADIDIESECLHCLGAARFDVWGALCVLRYRSYRATFRYCNATTTTTTTTTNSSNEAHSTTTWNTIQDDFVGLLVSLVSHAGKTAYTAPPKRFGDGVFHVMLIRRRTCSRYRLARILLGLETGQHVDLPGVEWITCTAYQWIPDDPNASCNDLDGEVVERGRVEARVLPQAVRYFGRPNDERSNSSTTSTKQKSE